MRRGSVLVVVEVACSGWGGFVDENGTFRIIQRKKGV